MRTLYLSDLDGTLLRSDERVSDYTVRVINRFVQRGGCFTYATARSFVTASKVTAGLDAGFPVICYNGAFIIDNGTGRVLHSHFFPRELAADARRVLTGHRVFPLVYAYVDGVERFSFAEGDINGDTRSFLESRRGDIRRRAVETADELYRGDIIEFNCIGNDAELAPIHRIFAADARYQCVYQKDVYSDSMQLEIQPENVSKAGAALRLKSMLGCDRLVVFGDGLNDLSMFAVADECYATANAAPELKAAATAVVGLNDDDGVARWIAEHAEQ